MNGGTLLTRDAAHQLRVVQSIVEDLAVKASSAQPKPPARRHRQQPRLEVERRQENAISWGGTSGMAEAGRQAREDAWA